ncbi:hypothetical protein [Acetobacter oeni]|nr:hypothetical protein [Acetobacter oeni]NHO17910.1 hypothetical protein [Acetobacter oeni]
MKKIMSGIALATIVNLGLPFATEAYAQTDPSLQPTDNALTQSAATSLQASPVRHAHHRNRVMPAANVPATKAPQSLESQETAQPLPSGYEPVEDFDVTLAAHSDAVLATKPVSGHVPIEAQQLPRSASSTAHQFDVFGVPVRVEAPVTPPYNASFTYENYGGQPGKGRDATGAWGAAGQP